MMLINEKTHSSFWLNLDGKPVSDINFLSTKLKVMFRLSLGSPAENPISAQNDRFYPPGVKIWVGI